jgi:hypothetical protein
MINQKLLLSIASFITICSTALADIDVTVLKTRALIGVDSPRIVGEVIIFNGDQAPSVKPAAIITIVTDYKFLKVNARTSLFETSNLTKTAEGEYLIVGAGRFAVEVTAFDPDKGIDQQTILVELEELSPVPKPDTPDNPSPPAPAPNVPADKFDNLGQRVAKLSASFVKKSEVIANYKQASKDFNENQSVTVNQIFDKLNTANILVLGSDYTSWKPFFDLVHSDMKTRWPISRLDLVQYFNAIIAGLEAK